MAAGTLYSKMDWAERSPPPNLPPRQVAWAMTRLTVSARKPAVSAPITWRTCSS